MFERILIIKHGAFGDLMQAQGALHDIRLAYPNAKLTLLTAPAYMALMLRNPHIDAVMPDPRPAIWNFGQYRRLVKQVQAQQFDCVVDLQNSSRTRCYHRLLFSKTHWIGRLPHEGKPSAGLHGLHVLLNKYNIATHHLKHPDLHWMVDDVTAILQQHAISERYILLIPGASAQHKEKRWPHYPALATLLTQQGYQVLTVLGPDEIQLAEDFSTAVLTDLNWFSLAGVIQQAAFVVGNDSGPSHLASGLQRPGLALFGPSTSALRAALDRGAFQTHTVFDLAALTADEVCQRVLDKVGA